MFDWIYCYSQSSYLKDGVPEIMAYVGIEEEKARGSCRLVGVTLSVQTVHILFFKIQYEKYGMISCTQSHMPK
jgi:hypothetical protein